MRMYRPPDMMGCRWCFEIFLEFRLPPNASGILSVKQEGRRSDVPRRVSMRIFSLSQNHLGVESPPGYNWQLEVCRSSAWRRSAENSARCIRAAFGRGRSPPWIESRSWRQHRHVLLMRHTDKPFQQGAQQRWTGSVHSFNRRRDITDGYLAVFRLGYRLRGEGVAKNVQSEVQADQIRRR